MEKDQINTYKIKETYGKFIKQNPSFLQSSKNKNINIVLGNTGSGKSTLVNYISGKELIVENARKIQGTYIGGNMILKNPNDSTAMKIGNLSNSETLYPSFIECKNNLYYDLPGFGDTRGIDITLINTTIIKHIIENANSVKILFIVSEAEIFEGCRGEGFRTLKEIAQKCFSSKIIEESSILVITKCNFSNEEVLKTEIKRFFGSNLDLTEPWINNNRIFKFSAPFNNKINEDDSKTILTEINKLKSNKIQINIDGIYTVSEQNLISKLMKNEINDAFNSFLNNLKIPKFDNLNLNQLKLKILELKDLKQKFLDFVDSNSKMLVNLLKSISNIYIKIIQEMKIEELETENVNLLSHLIEKKESQERERQAHEIARIKSEEARQSEENARIFREKARHMEENARLMAERLREQEERERARLYEEELKTKRSKFIRSIIGIYSGDSNPSIPNGYVKINQDLNQGAGGWYIYLCCSKEFYHGDPITNICFSHSGGNSQSYRNCPLPGHQAILSTENDLINTNRSLGRKGDNIGLWMNKSNEFNGNYGITDIWIGSFDSATNWIPSGYEALGIDLNKGAGGKYIYLAFKRESI